MATYRLKREHIIRIWETSRWGDGDPLRFRFESRDIGATQGTTLTLLLADQGYGRDTIIARYRPGTRYWDRAMEIAEEVIADAVRIANEVTSQDELSVKELRAAFDQVLTEGRYTPWDGTDPNDEDSDSGQGPW